MNADWNSNQNHIASSFLFSFSKLTSSRVAPPTTIITPATCYCCFSWIWKLHKQALLVQQPREQVGRRSTRSGGSEGQETGRPLENKKKVQRLSEGRSVSLAKWRPLEIRSVSGAAADQDSLCDVPIPRRYGQCEGPISVLLASAHCPTAGCAVLVRG